VSVKKDRDGASLVAGPDGINVVSHPQARHRPGHTVKDEGTPLTARVGLNFTGDSVVATDDAASDETDVAINLIPHAVVGSRHTATGLTPGWVLRATGDSTFEWGAIAEPDVPAAIARDTEVTAAVVAHEAAANPHPTYATDADLAAHVAAADPHTDYLRESVLTAKGATYIATASGVVVQRAVGTNGQREIADSAQSDGKKWVDDTRVLRATIDGAGAVITTGAKKAYLSVPIDCTITKARLLADVAGSIVLDVWVDTYANHPPTVADTIVAAAKPSLAAAAKSEDSTLTGWTTALSAGQVIEVNVDSAATLTKVHLDLFVRPR